MMMNSSVCLQERSFLHVVGRAMHSCFPSLEVIILEIKIIILNKDTIHHNVNLPPLLFGSIISNGKI